MSLAKVCIYIVFACASAAFPNDDIFKPSGSFASSPGDMSMFNHPELKGVLVRARWKDIEPAKGAYTFERLGMQISKVKMNGKKWSLGIMAGGIGSPAWIIEKEKVPYVHFKFRGETSADIPAFWDEKSLSSLALLAQALGAQFGNDPDLVLVYIPQMTANGIEGHLNGVDISAMEKIGYTDEKWISASCFTARAFATAFPNKALAFEVHEVNRSAEVPRRIITELWNDQSLGKRVGAAVWWLSGNKEYQSALLAVLRAYPGDIYCQMIGRSDQPKRFPEGYPGAWRQAKEINARYVEAWEWDFISGGRGANGAWDKELADFNKYAAELRR